MSFTVKCFAVKSFDVKCFAVKSFDVNSFDVKGLMLRVWCYEFNFYHFCFSAFFCFSKNNYSAFENWSFYCHKIDTPKE